MSEPVFHSDWFSKNILQWEKYLSHLRGVPYLQALEIGSWEGRSTCWTLQNILTDETCKMTCIDPFLGNPENKVEGYEGSVQDTFEKNIEAIGAKEKVTLLALKSHDALKYLHNNHFDFIYLDGSHVTTDVLRDLCLLWPLLKHGGVLIMDDYQYGEPSMDAFPGIAIDAFQRIFRKELIELHRGWQMIWRKI